MNLGEKAPSPQRSPAEREREKGRQRQRHPAKLMSSMPETVFDRFYLLATPASADEIAASLNAESRIQR